MNLNSLRETIQRVTREIESLKQDLKVVKSQSAKNHLKNEIHQKSFRLSRLISMNENIIEKQSKGGPKHAQKKEVQQGEDSSKPRRRYCKVIKDGSGPKPSDPN